MVTVICRVEPTEPSAGTWLLEDGIWEKTVETSTGITINDSVVMGDVIHKKIVFNDQDFVVDEVRKALANLGFNEGRHPSSVNEANRIQLEHTLTLADAISNENIPLDGWVEISLGYAHELEHNIPAARMNFENAMRFGTVNQDRRLQLHATLGIAILDLKSGKTSAAEKAATKLRREFMDMNDDVGYSNAEEVLGLIAYARGNYGLSASFHEHALELRKNIGYDAGIVSSSINLGNVAMSQEKVNAAADLFADAELFDQSERDEAQLLCSQGVNEMQKGNSRKALDLLNKSLAIRTAIKDKTGQIECYNYIGTALMMGRQFQAGRDMCRKALNLADEIKDYGAKAHALYHIGQASIGMGDRNSGIHELKKARSLFSLSQDREGISNCNKLLRKLDVYDVHMLFEPTALITACMVLLLIVLGFSI